jgi:hypothetical protein
MEYAAFHSSITGVNLPQKLRHPMDITAGENVKNQEENLEGKERIYTTNWRELHGEVPIFS